MSWTKAFSLELIWRFPPGSIDTDSTHTSAVDVAPHFSAQLSLRSLSHATNRSPQHNACGQQLNDADATTTVFSSAGNQSGT